MPSFGEFLMCVIYALFLALMVLLAFESCAIPYQTYQGQYDYETDTGWKLNTESVQVNQDFIDKLAERLTAINDCIVKAGYDDFDKAKWIVQLREQTCFSWCQPQEEFSCITLETSLCDGKRVPAGKKEAWAHCPCRYRTWLELKYNYIIVPMRSQDKFDPHGNWVYKTEVNQLNLWEILHAHVGLNWYKVPISRCQCVGGCQ